MEEVNSAFKKILIAEDDESIREALGYILKTLDLPFVTAPDGIAARDIIARDGVDILITDFEMPGMDGVELLNWCRGQHFHFPVIFVSANANLVEREKVALEDCCATLMNKPINLEAFEQALKSALVRNHHAGCIHRRETPI